MAISDDFINQLKGYNDIVSVMSSYVNLKRSGRGYTCLCPFHSENTPSCTVHPEDDHFYCFGCGAGGDVITFIRKIENLEYIEAIRFLAARAGLPMPEDAVNDELARTKAKVLEINRETARYYHALLLSDAGAKGMAYLQKRELTDKIITKYGLGYAPDDWQGLHRHLKQHGFSDEQQLAAAVVAMGRGGRPYDQFRNRVMFPIIDLRGNVIAFGGRLIEGDGPKYLNSSDTPVFKKSRNLFSLNFAKASKSVDTAKGKRLILAEGYMDVISIYQAGFHNVVATLGTALTKEQARLMSQYADDIVIAYDSDDAGQAATHKAINLLSEVGVRTRIIKMQGAKDPDEFIKKFGAPRFKLLLDGADNAIEFELTKAKAGLELDTDAGKIDYLKRAVGTLSEIASPLEREVYTSKIANELSVAKEVITLQVNAIIKRRIKKDDSKELFAGTAKYAHIDKINPEASKFPKEAKAEAGIIMLLYKHPDMLEQVKASLCVEDFVTEFHRRLFDFVVFKLENNHNLNPSTFASEFTPDEMGRIAGILETFNDINNLSAALKDYIDVLLTHKNKVERSDIATMTPEELRAYQAGMKTKKNRSQ